MDFENNLTEEYGFLNYVHIVQRQRMKEQGRLRQSDVEDCYSQNSSKTPSVSDLYNENEQAYEGDGAVASLSPEGSNGFNEVGLVDQAFGTYEQEEDYDGQMDQDEGLDGQYKYDLGETKLPTATLKTGNSRPLPKLVKATPGSLAMASAAGQRNMPNLGSIEGTGISTPSFSLTREILQTHQSGPPLGVQLRKMMKIVVDNSAPPGTSDQAAPYVCDLCGKRYVHHRSLNDHKKSHTGATRCPICNKSFSKVANMRAHYSAQHMSNAKDSDIPKNIQ